MVTTVQNPFDTQQQNPTNQNIQAGSTQPMAGSAVSSTPFQQYNPLPNLQPQTYTATTSQVNAPTETMQGQVASILSQDSPLMQRAKALATQEMAQRGLVNSSMAQGAGVAAMTDRALPIASQDAQTFSQRALINQDALNQANQFNVGQQNQLFQMGQDIASRFGLQTGQQQFQSEQATLDRALQTALQSNQITSQEFQQLRDISSREGLAAADRALQQTLQANQFNFQGAQAQLDRSLQTALQAKQISSQQEMQIRDISSREGLAAADRALQQTLQANQFNFQGTQAQLDRSLQTALQANQISSQQEMQIRDISSREGLAAADRALQQTLQANQIGFQSQENQLQRSFQERMTTLEQSGLDARQARDIASREMIVQLELQGINNRFDQELALKSDMFNAEQVNADRRQILDNNAQLERLGLTINAQERQLPTQFAATISNSTMAGVSAILSDPAMSAEAKSAQITNLTNYANSQLDWAEKFYDTAIPKLPGPSANPTNVAALYREILGREPEAGAAEAWANSGLTLEAARAQIASSPEAQARNAT
jgi:hypothetical protein